MIDDARALLQRLPHLGFAHHRQVADDLAVVEEAILAQDADARVRRDGEAALRGRLVAGQDAQERGLARSVGADEAVARAGVELQRDVLEQRASAERLAELGDADHGGALRYHRCRCKQLQPRRGGPCTTPTRSPGCAAQGRIAGASVVTSLPDVSELPALGFDGWRRWFVDAARAAMGCVDDDGVAIFFQSDIRHHGVWVDKGALVAAAAVEARMTLLFHKIVCRLPPGTATAGRASYAHLLGFARGRRPPRRATRRRAARRRLSPGRRARWASTRASRRARSCAATRRRARWSIRSAAGARCSPSPTRSGSTPSASTARRACAGRRARSHLDLARRRRARAAQRDALTLPVTRVVCARCRRPEVVCYCAQLPQLPTRTRVLVLQHPRERRVGIGTARMAQLALPNSLLRVGIDFADDPVVQRDAGGRGAELPALPRPRRARRARARARKQPITLVVVDGTWSQARTLVRVNPALAALPRIAFTPRRRSAYDRIRREPADFCVSTIEALTEVLNVLEPDGAPFDPLLVPFHAMVDAPGALRHRSGRRAATSDASDRRARAARRWRCGSPPTGRASSASRAKPTAGRRAIRRATIRRSCTSSPVGRRRASSTKP